MNGSNDEDNLVYLYAQEHYYAHKLLAQENPENKELLYAWWMMGNKNKISVTAEEYAELKNKFINLATIQNKGENNPFYGKHHSEETKKKMSEANKGREFSKQHKEKLSEQAKNKTGSKNPFYGKHHSDDTKEQIRQKKIGQIVSDETKRKISQRHSGKKFSEERKNAISKALKGKEKTKEHSKHISEAKKGTIMSENQKMSISKTMREKISKGEIDYSDRCRKVNQIDKNTNEIIKTFESIIDAAKELGVNNTVNIIRVCKHKPHCKTAYGYKWEYAD